MATFKPVVFTGGEHLKSDGTTNIKIRVYHNLKSQYIPTNYYIKPEFLLSSGEVSDELPDAGELNYELGAIIQEYRGIQIKIGRQRLKSMSSADLKNYILSETNPEDEFIDFVAFSNSVISETLKPKTANWLKDSLNAFTWFYGSEKINITNITSKKLREFVKQLRIKGKKGKPLEPGTINNYLRGLRDLYNLCKLENNDEDNGIIRIPNEPFKRIEFPQYRKKKKNIDVEILNKIISYTPVTFREQLGRDVFLMQFYLMGINIIDLFELNRPKKNRVQYSRKKTDTEKNINNFILSIKAEPEFMVLANKYSDSGFLSKIKGRYSDVEHFNKAVNKGLKSICEQLNVEKVTSNWSRHTWASIARNKAGISKADIDFCLGHVSNDHKMADIYIEIDYSIYDRVNRQVLDLLK